MFAFGTLLLLVFWVVKLDYPAVIYVQAISFVLTKVSAYSLRKSMIERRWEAEKSACLFRIGKTHDLRTKIN